MNKQDIIKKYELEIDPSIIIEDNEEHITCRICGFKSKRLYGRHFKSAHNDIKSKEYKTVFPGSLTMSSKDNKATTINGGKHMQTEKYRNMFSKMFSGENNANHKSNTTEQQRKEKSPFSMEFYKKKYPNNTEEENKELLHTFAKKSCENRITNTNIEYYLNKGMSQEEAAEALKERQAVGRLDKFIERYGEEEGKLRWKQRQAKWIKSYKKVNFSKISQDLFKELYIRIKDKYQNVYFAVLDDNKNIDESGRNFEYRLELNESYILPDFFVEDIGKIIEFDGSYYHRTNTENVKRELKRDKGIIDKGYEVYHVKESDYRKDKEKVMQSCIEFLSN